MRQNAILAVMPKAIGELRHKHGLHTAKVVAQKDLIQISIDLARGDNPEFDRPDIQGQIDFILDILEVMNNAR